MLFLSHMCIKQLLGAGVELDFGFIFSPTLLLSNFLICTFLATLYLFIDFYTLYYFKFLDL
jgi:hypothetical protein